MQANKYICVLRSQGERTEELSRKLLENEFGISNTYVVHEIPFVKALIRSFEIGIESCSDWTFCIDADVLLRPGAIKQCIEYLERVHQCVFKVQPRLISKFHGAKIAAGFHIYRTNMLPKSLSFIDADLVSLRPETFILREMIKCGYKINHMNYIAGIHEFELGYSDIYRRMRARGSKAGQYEYEFLKKRFDRLKNSDIDYLFALNGINDSSIKPVKSISKDAIDENDILYLLKKFDIEEKHRIDNSFDGLFVKNVIDEFLPEKDALEFMNYFENNNFNSAGVRVLLISSASIGPYYISTLLKRHNHQVLRLFQGYEEYLGEPSTVFLPPLKKDELLSFNPDVIGFSVDSSTFIKAKAMACEIKSILPNCFIIFGGPHPTDCPELTIQSESIDAICIGEGEYPMLEVCNELKEGNCPINVENIWIKHNGKIYKNKLRPYLLNLDEIPMDRENVWYGGVFTGRGCVGKCSFCNIPAYRKHGPKGKFFRKLSFDAALNEVDTVYKGSIERIKTVQMEPITYKILSQIFSSRIMGICFNQSKWVKPSGTYRREKKYETIFDKIFGRTKWIDPVRFKDDTFLADKKWFIEFAKKLQEKYPDLTYICQARANEIDEEVVSWLSKSGCVMVSLGFETGDERLRNQVVKKNIANKQIYEACRLLNDNNIKIMGQWMYGLPDETFMNSLKTLIMSVNVGDFPQLHFTSPLPSTELYDIAINRGLIKNDYINKGLYNSELIFHNESEKMQLVLISILHVLKDVVVPLDYSFIRYLGSFENWQGKTLGEIISLEFKNNFD